MKSRYIQAFAIAAYVGTVSALGVFFTALTQGLSWRQMLSIIGASFIMPFAALSKALPDPLHPQPTVTVDHADTMTTNVTNNPAPPSSPPSPDPAPLLRNPQGQFVRKVPPLDPLSDH
jgi:hypothetical protein